MRLAVLGLLALTALAMGCGDTPETPADDRVSAVSPDQAARDDAPVVLPVDRAGAGTSEPPEESAPESAEPAPEPAPEHSVLVYFTYPHAELTELFALEERLSEAIVAASAGEFDGNEVSVDGTDCMLFMYGPDADALFAAVRPVLEASEFMKGARVKLRYGPPDDGVREVEVVLAR